MNWEAMFPGKFIKSAEFGGKDVTLTIKGVALQDLPDDKGGEKRRGVVSFVETPRALVANRTNATCLAKMFGPETEKWRGKRVTLYAAPFNDPFTGEVGTATRVRGSPDIDAPLSFTAKIGRKQVPFKLVKTGQQRQQPQSQQQKPTEPPPPSDDFGPEPPPDMSLPGSEGFTNG